MKKKRVIPFRGKKMERYVLRYFFTFLLVSVLTPGMAFSFAQVKVNVNVNRATLQEVFTMIQSQCHLRFLYSNEDVNAVEVMNLNVKNEKIEAVLETVLRGTGLTFRINDEIIFVKKADQQVAAAPQSVTITGKVVDKKGGALPGVTVTIKGTTIGVSTDVDGQFKLLVPNPDVVLAFSFVGLKKQEIRYTGQKALQVVMEEEAAEMEEVVVTGIFQRKASSFTGSAVSMSKDELMRVSSQNLFSSLKNLDPSLMIFDNLEFGSDPNKLPDMQLRGTSAFPLGNEDLDLKGNYANNPNLPLFILDGFEASVEKIFDMDMNRVESVTILKDAAAKAIYGSKAANGVVVVETKQLQSGRLRISYTGNVDITAPDLSSYDLCSPAEKLELERLYGMYENDRFDTWLKLQEQYNQRLSAVVSGVYTDWMSKPLRTGVGHKHTLSVELGDQNLRLIADLSYNNVAGVMKGSDRTTISGAVSISYRHQNFNFRNVLTVTDNQSSDSPYGSFSEYSRMNPYWTPYDEFGNLVKNAEIVIDGNAEVLYPNPLYNSQLNTKLTSSYLDVTNNFYTEWNIIQELKATIRFGITKKKNKADQYYPANHLKFSNYTEEDFFRKGSYQVNEGENKRLSGDFNMNYSKEFAEKHYVFGNVGLNLSENTFEEVIYNAEGFPSDRMNNIMFARQYTKDQKPNGSEGTTRDMGVLAVVNYSYDNRLMMDASYRANASSQFGKNNRWGNFWSLGAGWNIHNEKFLKGNQLFEQLKLRGSLGYTGSQGFSAYQSMATYKYFLDKTYVGFLGSYLKGMVNDDLKWQKKMDYNVGLDVNLKRKLVLKFDYYLSITDNTLVDFTLPTSTGFRTVKENVGQIKNTGLEGRITWTAFSRPKDRAYLTFTASAVHNKNRITKISNALESRNKEQDQLADDRFNNKPVIKYYEGMSMNAIWAVPSLGIDPANGREIYVNKQGKQTYSYSASDMVVCGDEQPKISGNFGMNVEYKGIGLNMVFRYQYGAQLYNQTLVDRVENVDMNYNLDRRLLKGRWQNAGDKVPYKALAKVWIAEDQEWRMEKTQPTSRFVQDRNELDLSSVSLSYDFYRHAFLKKMNMERLKLSFYMNDVFKISSIDIERGLSYPFARSFNFSLQATF